MLWTMPLKLKIQVIEVRLSGRGGEHTQDAVVSILMFSIRDVYKNQDHISKTVTSMKVGCLGFCMPLILCHVTSCYITSCYDIPFLSDLVLSSWLMCVCVCVCVKDIGHLTCYIRVHYAYYKQCSLEEMSGLRISLTPNTTRAINK
jgi:hypothetical protein